MTSSARLTRQQRSAGVLQWGGLLVILIIAVLRMVTSFNHVIVFDVDPALDPYPFAGLAAGSLWLDGALLCGAAAALAGWSLSRGAVNWVILTAALLPMPVVLVHGFDDLGDIRKGATWSAAAVAGVVIAHLRQRPAMRVVIVMVLAGALGPLLVRGATNVTYEYDETLQFYEQQKQFILADKGWDEGSASAKIYQRRLEQRQPTAWFATTNIFGTFMAGGVVLWLGLAVAAVRARLTSGWAGLGVLFALLCAAGLWMTDSNGALLACAAGLATGMALIVIALRGDIWSRRMLRLAPVGVVLVVLCALAGIVVRGAVLPESFAGEISLLFRWHYIVSASRMIMEHPWLGVGPDEFQAMYMLHRVPRNPEEVASAHSMFIDWLATLGVLALAWVGVVLALLWRGGRQCAAEPDQSNDDAAMAISPVGAVGVTVAVMVFAVALAVVWERHTLDVLSATMRLLGVLSFAVMALIAGHIVAHGPKRMIDIALIAVAIVLLVHGQIEMTWTQPGSVVMAWVLLGAAAPLSRRGGRRIGMALSVFVIGAAAWIAITAAVPASRLQSRMVEAAHQLQPIARARQAHLSLMAAQQHGDHAAAASYRRDRDAVLRELHIEPPTGDVNDDQLEQLLRETRIERRLAAAAELEQAYRDWPHTEDGLAMASRQLGLASREMQLPQRLDVLQRSVELGEESAAAHNDVASAALAIDARLKLHELTGQREHMDTAIELARWLAGRDPLGVRAWVSLGNVLWQDEQYDAAADAYRKAIEHSDNFALDSYKQLDAETRERLESRVAQTGGGP